MECPLSNHLTHIHFQRQILIFQALRAANSIERSSSNREITFWKAFLIDGRHREIVLDLKEMHILRKIVSICTSIELNRHRRLGYRNLDVWLTCQSPRMNRYQPDISQSGRDACRGCYAYTLQYNPRSAWLLSNKLLHAWLWKSCSGSHQKLLCMCTSDISGELSSFRLSRTVQILAWVCRREWPSSSRFRFQRL